MESGGWRVRGEEWRSVGFADEEEAQTAPEEHAERRGRAEDDDKDGDDRGIKDESAQDGGERRGEEHGERRTPEFPGVGYGLPFE